MAITIDKTDLGSTADNASATTVAFTTTNAVAANGFIVVTVTWFLSGFTTLASVSGGGLTWAIDKQGNSTTDGASCAVVSAQAPAGLASGTTITATFTSGSPTGRSICGSSFTGVLSSAALDTTSGPTNTPSGTAWTSANTTIAAGSLLIANSYGINTNDTSTVTSPSIEAHDIPGAAGTFGSTTCYRIEAAGGAFTVAGTWSGAEVGLTNAAAYKAAPAVSGGGAPFTPWNPMLRRYMPPALPMISHPLQDLDVPATVTTALPPLPFVVDSAVDRSANY